MSTEKALGDFHSGFWRTTLPLLDAFVRTMNRSLERYAPPMHSTVSPDRRGIVNEAGFRVFVAAIRSGTPPSHLARPDVDRAWALGVEYVGRMRQFLDAAIDPIPRSDELQEAVAIAHRTVAFFLGHGCTMVVTEPRFKGCGWIDATSGDVFADSTLVEIKAGDRQFRSVDLHQLLTYCALNFASKDLDIRSVCLLNPRVGTSALFDVDELCNECAGASAAEVLNEIVQYISEPLGLYGG